MAEINRSRRLDLNGNQVLHAEEVAVDLLRLAKTCGHLFSDMRAITAIEVCEQFADGKADGVELARAVLLAREMDRHQANDSAGTHSLAVLRGVVADRPEWNKHRLGRILQVHRNAESRLNLCGLVRDIFVNPFRPVVLDPSWQTSTAVALARQMYESHDFSPMPILADAIQDAGCEHPDIIDHCRGHGPHVRGCWVVDLVLGKE